RPPPGRSPYPEVTRPGQRSGSRTGARLLGVDRHVVEKAPWDRVRVRFGVASPQTLRENSRMPAPAVPIRVVLAKVGLDGHDRGIKVVARALRDAGMHVIYAGLWQTPEAVVRTVADEDADWLGLSLLSGAHMTLVPRVLQLLREAGLEHVGV